MLLQGVALYLIQNFRSALRFKAISLSRHQCKLMQLKWVSQMQNRGHRHMLLLASAPLKFVSSSHMRRLVQANLGRLVQLLQA